MKCQWALNHQQELQVILDLEKIDVCLISETHFTKESYVRYKGYKVYHTIHPDNAAKGGSAVIIKKSIFHYQKKGFQSEKFQATAVKVRTVNYDIIVRALYCPPRHSLREKHYFEFLRSQGRKLIIGGDFNVKHKFWGSRLITTKGRALLNAGR